MATTQDAGVTVTPATQLPVGTPGRTAPILFGFAGAWWASNKAKSLGVTDTKRYWIAAAISTGVTMLASLLVPVLFLFVLSASLGGSSGTENIFNDPAVRAPLTSNSGNAPVAPVAQAPASPTPIPVTTTVSASSPLGLRLFIADNMNDFKPIAARPSDDISAILKSFNSSWVASCTGGPNQPSLTQYMWGFVYDTSGPFYTEWGSDQFATTCGKFILADPSIDGTDHNAANNLTTRKYKVNVLINGSRNLGLQTLQIKLIHELNPAGPAVSQDHWMLTDLS